MRLQKNGFTLIELLVVIAIIGVLSAVAIMAYTSVTSKAKDTKRQEDLKTLSQALELYANSSLGSNRGYPSTDITGCSDILYTSPTFKNYLHNQEVPKDPSGEKYCYVPLNNGESYRLYSKVDNCDQSNIPNKECTQNTHVFSVTSPDLIITAPDNSVLSYLGNSSPAPAGGGGNTPPVVPPVAVAACASGTNSQLYSTSMVGCNGNVTFSSAASLCGANSHVCSFSEYISNGGSTVIPNSYISRWINAYAKAADYCISPLCGGTICDIYVPSSSETTSALASWNGRLVSYTDKTSCSISNGTSGNVGYFAWASITAQLGTMCCSN